MSAWNTPDASPAREILVFVDRPEAELDDTGKGILSEATRLSRTLGCPWTAVTFGEADKQKLEEFAPYGTERVLLIEGPEALKDSLELQARLLASVARQRGSDLLLLPHNDLGGSLAPLLAAELDAALFTEAIGYTEDRERLRLTRQILGAQVAENRLWSTGVPLVLTMAPRVLSAVVLPTMTQGEAAVESWRPDGKMTGPETRIIERIPPDPQTVDLAEAEVIVSGGLGCSEQTFAKVEELTRLLGASLGVTRPVYDRGCADFERMVGQTGKTVAPRFYLALGISGSMHHLGGIKDSKRVVAVNIDPKAPIFPNSDQGYVADLDEVLPMLIEKVRSASGGAA